MKPRSRALFIYLLLVCAMSTSYTFAQSTGGQKDEQKKDEQTPAPQTPKLAVKLFEIKYRNPSSLALSLQSLGSGAPNTSIYPNNDLKTLTVRDFPENIAAIEEALKRLDAPNKSPVSLEFQLHLIAASMTPSEKPTVPKNLEPIVEQLKSTLKFTNYHYVSSAMSRVSDRGSIESNGVTGSLYPNMNPNNPAHYQYSLSRASLTQDAAGKESIQIEIFKFVVNYVVRNPGDTQNRSVGITTPLSLREGEIAVVGTANISGSDEAIIVAISVKKAK